MNGNAFGFPAYPQQPSVAPQAVGAALQQMPPAAPAPAPVATPSVPATAPTSVTGTLPDRPDPDPDPALHLAMREAIERLTAGTQSMGQQGEPGNPYNAVQLARLGLSPMEIKLLQMTGGSR